MTYNVFGGTLSLTQSTMQRDAAAISKLLIVESASVAVKSQ